MIDDRGGRHLHLHLHLHLLLPLPQHHRRRTPELLVELRCAWLGALPADPRLVVDDKADGPSFAWPLAQESFSGHGLSVQLEVL